MAETKMTKKMWFEEIRNIVEAADVEDKAGMLEFIDTQLAQLATRAEKAAERAAKKKADGDALRDTVEAVLTDELQTADEITAQIDEEGISKAKVTARLTQLIKAGKATKDIIKTEDSRKVTAYKIC